VDAVSNKQAADEAVRGHAPAGGLQLRLDAPLPDELSEGPPNALFVCGWCFHAESKIAALGIVVNCGEPQPVMEHGMPRLDVLRAFHPGRDPYDTGGLERDPDSADDPLLHSYLSGFWGFARLPALRAGETCELTLRAELEGGGIAETELARIPVIARPDPVAVDEPDPSAGPFVAICMATYEPPMDLFRRQVESIRAQTHTNWVCVVSDDCSSPERFAEAEVLLREDPRFVVSRSPRRLGFYRNFERALSLAPAGARYVTMVDQDDEWHPDKLAALLAGIGNAQLVYSDQRIVSRDGELISDTYWRERSNNHSDLLSLLVANSVTGAASLFGRELLDYALPFPPAQFAHFHDHWIALTALSLGDIAFVDRPLYDYVQHGDASLGHAEANRMTTLRDRLATIRRDPRERVRKWRMHYFVDVCRLTQVAEVLRLRCGERMPRRKRRELERFLNTDRSLPSVARLAARGARELVGRPETLGAEWMLAFAYTWRRALSATVRERPQRGLRLDAVPPPSLAPKPGRTTPQAPAVRAVAEKIAPLELAVRDDAPQRVNILIPTIDLEHFFGGYIAKFNLAKRLSERGLRVRIVTVDPVGPLPGSWQAQLEAYSGLSGLFERVEVAFGREAEGQGGLEVSRDDRFVASTWWSAHVAAAALRTLGGGRFVYLIQEYEPFTFPMGTYAALARGSYDLPHFALFSTELLRDYFRRHGIGVYAAGAEAGDADSAAFENAITAIEPPNAAELAARDTRRLLFYARPEPHAARNMFELGVLALSRALADGAFAGWELHGIGSLEAGRHVDLGGGARLRLLPRSDQEGYADLLRGHDVGLALMYTPHPSLVPIEMASAGALTVTNSFENKTPDAMAAISSNLITAAPTIEGVASGLLDAAAGVDDFERRARGSEVHWSKDWRRSFGDELLDRVAEFLEG
jgi:glycosyltransferase involved in cell wall biosynthesis